MQDDKKIQDEKEAVQNNEELETPEFIDEDSDEVIEIDEDILEDDIVDTESVEDIILEEDTDSNEMALGDVLMAMDDMSLSKHTEEGKHSLKYDSIFKGKKEDSEEDEDIEKMFINENFEVDKGSQFWSESIDNENYVKDKRVKEKVYDVLKNHTDLNFMNNRRKPSKNDFNKYYFLLKTHLKEEKFTNIEIFNELSVYFSDNLFNMFKLLDNKWRNMIINELQDHIGRKRNSTELLPRNIHKDTEVEFEWLTEEGNLRLITGVIVECDYEAKEYTVDSYESIYNITINDITKILNNSKFKYNLNKLNNIDFL
jgi:hypothetical protein